MMLGGFCSMGKTVFLALIFLPYSFYLYSVCPSPNCPADRDSMALEYLFEGNLNDTSGNGLDAATSPYFACPPVFATGIGGRSGTVLQGMPFGKGCGLRFPACALYHDEGEIEWYQYITNTAAPVTSTGLWWCNSDCSLGFIRIYASDGAAEGGTSMRIDYTYLNSGGGIAPQELISECIVANTWQHISFQWGNFGTRLVVDGIPRVGSYAKWDQNVRDYQDAFIYTGLMTSMDGFMGYIDDFRIWSCAGHGTPTITRTLTPANTPTITPTSTISMTSTVTTTFTVTQTSTVTPTITQSLTSADTPFVTATPTYTPTLTPTFTATETITLSATPFISCTYTPTCTQTPRAVNFTLYGNFPNPFTSETNIIVGLPHKCGITVNVYTVSGEKVNSFSFNGTTGMNSFTIANINSGGVMTATGIYIYSVSASLDNAEKRVLWGKFAVLR
jgi:hypothetical protein